VKPHTLPSCGSRHGSVWPCSAKTSAAGVIVAALLLGLSMPALPQEPPADPAAALQAKHIELQLQLRTNDFGEPLSLNSREDSDQVAGNVHAEVSHPFADIAATFTSARAVCELLFLHLNVHACQPSTTASDTMLTLTVGPKRAQAPGTRYRMDYVLRVETATAAYLRVTLSAAQGPLLTRDYRIVFEAVPMDSRHSFVHLGYAYSYGTLASIAMKTYLATAGRSKIGFTVVGQSPDGEVQYVRGERAALERNVIRYYLAVRAYLGVTKGTAQEQMAARLRTWFALTERYAAQLHELELGEYLQEKHDDLARDSGETP